MLHGASGPSKGENERLTIDVAENIHSLLHFRCQMGPADSLCRNAEVHGPRSRTVPFMIHVSSIYEVYSPQLGK
jgi:hypothetical protein